MRPDPDEGVLVVCGAGPWLRAVGSALEQEGFGVGCAVAAAPAAAVDAGWPVWPLAEPTEDAVDAVIDAAIERLPDLVGIVAIQQELEPDDFLSLGDECWRAAVGWNLRLPFLVARRAIEEFLANRTPGRIVNVGLQPPAGEVGHALGSACVEGLRSLSRTLMKEVGRRQITVNTVLAPRGTGADTAVDLGESIRFLFSKDAAFVTGECLSVGRNP